MTKIKTTQDTQKSDVHEATNNPRPFNINKVDQYTIDELRVFIVEMWAKMHRSIGAGGKKNPNVR